MKNQVKHIEEMGMNAFPALQTVMYDGWIMRFSNGYTYRANSVNPLYASAAALTEKIAYCEQAYRRRGLSPVFKTNDYSEQGLQELLQARGYQTGKAVDIMRRELAGFAYAGDLTMVRIDRDISARWLDGFVALNGIEGQPDGETAKKILANIRNPVLCASIEEDGRIVSCGMGVCERGHIGLYDIFVHAACRNRGLAGKLCSKIVLEGMNLGAHTGYLQVNSNNEPAIRLYEKMGFAHFYTYRYHYLADGQTAKIPSD